MRGFHSSPDKGSQSGWLCEKGVTTNTILDKGNQLLRLGGKNALQFEMRQPFLGNPFLANPALSQERKGIHVFRSLCSDIHSVLLAIRYFLAPLFPQECDDWAHGLINGESLKNERTEHGPSTNANRNGISPSPYPRNRSSSPLRG